MALKRSLLNEFRFTVGGLYSTPTYHIVNWPYNVIIPKEIELTGLHRVLFLSMQLDLSSQILVSIALVQINIYIPDESF